MSSSPKILFIPVSSAEGMGEYMRCVILADAINKTFPSADIHFILSEQAPYALACPYPYSLLKDSPTKAVASVNHIISSYQPDVVFFDASGRKSQLSHAYKLGAKVIFLSQHKRKRARGMKIGRALVTDCHWVVQPEFVIGAISCLDRIKLKLINRPEPINIGPVFTQPDKVSQVTLLSRYQLMRNEFVLFNAGSGGHKVRGELAADIFAKAAHASYLTSGIVSVMVFGPNYPSALPQFEGVIAIKQLNNKEFINILSAAKAAVLSGGDTLLQAIALRVPTLTAPVSKDQPPRIAACVVAQLAVSSATELEMLKLNVERLLTKENIVTLITRLKCEPNMNGLEVIIQQLQLWFDVSHNF
ncbi:MAG: hypothetical protein ACRCT7_03760 [Shewanella sp.]